MDGRFPSSAFIDHCLSISCMLGLTQKILGIGLVRIIPRSAERMSSQESQKILGKGLLRIVPREDVLQGVSEDTRDRSGPHCTQRRQVPNPCSASPAHSRPSPIWRQQGQGPLSTIQWPPPCLQPCQLPSPAQVA